MIFLLKTATKVTKFDHARHFEGYFSYSAVLSYKTRLPGFDTSGGYDIFTKKIDKGANGIILDLQG